jgi:hypothetical protein
MEIKSKALLGYAAVVIGTVLAVGVNNVVHAQATVAGFTPGSFRVTESGSATYRIPIQVPPGIAGELTVLNALLRDAMLRPPLGTT